MNVSRRRVLQGGALGLTATLLGWRPVLPPVAEAQSVLPALPAVGELIVQQYGAAIAVTDLAAQQYDGIQPLRAHAKRRLYDNMERWIARVPHVRIIGEPNEWHAGPGMVHDDPLEMWGHTYGLKWSAEVRVTPAIRAYLAERQREMAAA